MNVEITYLNNSGIIIQSDDYQLIIDGITSGKSMFDPPTDELKSFIDNKIDEFAGKKIMLFTHCHSDHFCDENVCYYIQNGIIDNLIIPYDIQFTSKCVGEISSLTKIITVDNDSESKKIINTKELTIDYFNSNHLPYGSYDDSQHYCIRINISGEQYVVIGDADAESMKEMLGHCDNKINGLFITPVILGRIEWMEPAMISDIDKIYVYHLPSEINDKYGYRKLANYKYKEYKNRIQNINLLLNQMDCIKQ